MRTFIVMCLLAVAAADKLGYNYQPVPHSDEGLSFQPGSGDILSQPIESVALAPAPAPLAVAPAPVAVAQAPVTYAPVPAPAIEQFQKEFYSYTAPEHEFDNGGDSNIANSLNKKLRVVFIRGPENTGIENAALQLAQQAGDERTAIYVLQRQSDVNGLAQRLQQHRAQSQNRPEVHFVKYRTQQDAQNAQNAIQSQYDQLPGTSHSTNEGSAPVLNFASQAAPIASSYSAPAAPVAPVAAVAPAQQYLPANPVVQQNYLPPSLRRYVRF